MSPPIVDPRVLGRLLRAARVMTSTGSVEALARRMRDRGFEVSPRTIYAWERGEAVPSLTMFLAIAVELDPPGHLSFFAPAMAPRIRSWVEGRKIREEE